MADVILQIDGKPVPEPVQQAAVLQAFGAHTRVDVRLQPLALPTPVPPRKAALDAVKAWVGKPFELTVRVGAAAVTYAGVVTRIAIDRDGIGVAGRGASHLLDSTPQSRGFEDKSIADLLRAALQQLPKKQFTPGRSAVRFPFVAQYQETDFEFLTRMAGYDGYVVYDPGDGLVVAPEVRAGGVVALRPTDLPAGPGEVAVEPAATAATAVACGYNPRREATADAPKYAPSGDFAEAACQAATAMFTASAPLIHTEYLTDSVALKRMVESRSREAGAGMVEYRFTTTHPKVRLGSRVTLTGHPYANGELVVVESSLGYESGGYRAHVVAVPSELAAGAGPRSARPLDVVAPATVQDNADPDGLGRVRVKFPWSVPAPWVRVTAAGAGAAHGAFWAPQQGDEVLVAFEHGDPSRPVVVGSLYHSQARPPVVAGQPPAEFLLGRTPHGSEVRLVDSEGHEEIRIRVRDGQSEVRVILNPNPEVRVKTAGTCHIDAANFVVEATGDIKMTAAGEVVLQGQTIRLN